MSRTLENYLLFSCTKLGQTCVNESGSHRCGCKDGYQKHPDPKSDVCILAHCETGYKLEVVTTNKTEVRTVMIEVGG